MKIYNIKNTIYSLFLLGLFGCNDSFLDRYPEDRLTEKNFFQNPQDLEAYTNGLYNLNSAYDDIVSDNIVYNDDDFIYTVMRGEHSPDKAGSWSWSGIRNINFMLARVDQIEGDENDINHYIGLARLFRAVEYYNKVLQYSDVPWYGIDLETTDTELLYKSQDSRAVVVDSLMSDLEYAVLHIKEGTSKTKVHKNVALAVQARIALEEGSWRKYHDELGLDDGDEFLKIAVEASQAIINSGNYTLVTEPQGDLPAYTSLFSSLDLTNNPEMILVDAYDKNLGRMHNAHSLFNWAHTLSRDLMEDYLVIQDGRAVPFHTIPGYDTMGVNQVFESRDPRMEQTLMKPGFILPGSTKPERQNLALGGYPQVKFSPTTYDQLTWEESYSDLPIIRYAEILLINAEAKAELGELTQEDIDKTINVIRRRASMPDVDLNDWAAQIDPVQAERYSNVRSDQEGAVYEIRRERRIELACEGVRYGDLMRWALGNLLENTPEGIYIKGPGLYDITGDGNPDIVFGNTREEVDALVSTLSQEQREEYQLTTYILDGNTFELTQGDQGHIRMKVQVDKWTFEEPKYYYRPISQHDLNVNENLVQNKYW